MFVVLPTMELVYERSSYCYLFDFCEGGIREVIREAVNYYGTGEVYIERLINKLLSRYENSYSYIFQLTTENYNSSILVEIGIRDLISDVHAVIYNLYRNQPIEFNTKYCQWVGNDIAVTQKEL